MTLTGSCGGQKNAAASRSVHAGYAPSSGIGDRISRILKGALEDRSRALKVSWY